jgi:hypothetical protein
LVRFEDNFVVTCTEDAVGFALHHVTTLACYAEEIVEANGESLLWKYFLATKTVAYRKEHPKERNKSQSLPILKSLYNLVECGLQITVIEPEEIVMLLDDELAKELDDGIFPVLGTLDQLIRYDPSFGESVLTRVLWFQKVRLNHVVEVTMQWCILRLNSHFGDSIATL